MGSGASWLARVFKTMSFGFSEIYVSIWKVQGDDKTVSTFSNFNKHMHMHSYSCNHAYIWNIYIQNQTPIKESQCNDFIVFCFIFVWVIFFFLCFFSFVGALYFDKVRVKRTFWNLSFPGYISHVNFSSLQQTTEISPYTEKQLDWISGFRAFSSQHFGLIASWPGSEQHVTEHSCLHHNQNVQRRGRKWTQRCYPNTLLLRLLLLFNTAKPEEQAYITWASERNWMSVLQWAMLVF